MEDRKDREDREDSLIMQFVIWGEEPHVRERRVKRFIEQLECAHFAVEPDQGDRLVRASKLVPRVGKFPLADIFSEIGKIPTYVTLHKVKFTYHNMVLAPGRKASRSSEHGFRSGIAHEFFEDVLFLIDCCPQSREVIVSLSATGAIEKSSTAALDAFTGMCSRVELLAQATDAITELIQAFRTQPPNKGFVGRAIRNSYLDVGRLF